LQRDQQAFGTPEVTQSLMRFTASCGLHRQVTRVAGSLLDGRNIVWARCKT